MNFDQAPMLVIWEATQACDLACVHCRASAQSERSATELTTEQGYRLLDEIRSFGEPLMVFTGGDPLKRPDLFDLIRYSVKIGLRTNVTPERHAAAHGGSHRQIQGSRRVAHGDQRGRARCRVARRFPRHPRHLRSRHVRPAPTHATSASTRSSRPR